MKSITKKQENTAIWFIKQISGVLVFVLIIVHLIVNHMVAPTGLLSYNDVVLYFANPWIALMEIIFLIVVTGHSLLGLRSIILDLNPSISVIKKIDALLVIVGIAASVYGIWLTLLIGGRA